MAYKCGNRTQTSFLPSTIEDYVSSQDPVRVYDAFVDSLGFKALGISLDPQAGADTYFPRAMLKLIVYGYSYGIRSSRKLERACHHNLSFQWLMGGEMPDYRTIARFRSRYKEAIKKILKQCVRLCVKLDLIEGNTLFTDGSKFRANASINNHWTKEKCERRLEKIDKQIDQLLEDAEQLDLQEDKEESMVKLNKEIESKEKLIEKIKETLQTLEETQQKSTNSTDPDCVKAHGRQGNHASYNVQSTVDEKHGLIVQAEAVSQGNDLNQLHRQISEATEVLEVKPKNVCADAGYASTQDLKEIDEEIRVIVPSTRQTQIENDKHAVKEFDKEHFVYDKEKDEYICPAGKTLRYQAYCKGENRKQYQAGVKDCQQCPHHGTCTTSKAGRQIMRMVDQEIKERFEAIYASPEGQDIYKVRKEKVELPFGHMKRNLGAGQFMLRGKPKVDAEVSILSTCFNIARMITLFGIPKLILELNNA